MRSDIATHTVELVSVKEMAATLNRINEDLTILHGLNSTIAVVPSMDPNHKELKKLAEIEVRLGDKLKAYLFTWNTSGVEEEIALHWEGWEVEPLPAEMLAELRRLAPATTLFEIPEGEK
jgi:hypothetical protein